MEEIKTFLEEEKKTYEDFEEYALQAAKDFDKNVDFDENPSIFQMIRELFK